jgi:hypothetical protein
MQIVFSKKGLFFRKFFGKDGKMSTPESKSTPKPGVKAVRGYIQTKIPPEKGWTDTPVPDPPDRQQS